MIESIHCIWTCRRRPALVSLALGIRIHDFRIVYPLELCNLSKLVPRKEIHVMKAILSNGITVRSFALFALAILFGLAAVATPPAQAQSFATLTNFDQGNGAWPDYMSLVQGPDGTLYGTASSGGVQGCPSDPYVPADECWGLVFSFSPDGPPVSPVMIFNETNGANPVGGLVYDKENESLYGTTYAGGDAGGSSNCGTIFSTSGGTPLHSFTGSDGCNPTGTLVLGTEGDFYGTTLAGYGTIFKYSPTSNSVTTLYAFNGNNGNSPYAGLIQGADGNFYGTTEMGGMTAQGELLNMGTVFKITPTGTLTILHNFTGPDGAFPYGVLVQGADGNFYGTTEQGGKIGPNLSDYGTVFKITPAGVLTTIYSFGTGAYDGINPYAGLIQVHNGNFYGTTSGGGAYNSGTIFQITTSGTMTVLHSFCATTTREENSNGFPMDYCTDGNNPVGGLVQASNGSFYGTTYAGGTNTGVGTSGWGTVFEYTPAISTQTITFPAPTSPVTYGVAPIPLLATASSGLTVTFSVTSGPATVSGNLLTITGAGTVKVAANQVGNNAYEPAPTVTNTIAVNKAPQKITFTPLPAQETYPTVTSIPLSATASSGLTVTFSATGPATVSGNTLIFTGPGTVVVTASQPGNANYNPAPSVSQTIKVIQGLPQTITFPCPASPVTYGVAPIPLSATASSGLTVNFSVTSGPATVSGNTLTIIGAGTVVVTASQPGNAVYAPATAVSCSIAVNKASQTINFPAPTSPVTYGVAPFTLSATASSGLPVTFTVTSGPGTVSGNILTITGAGTVVVTASQAGNANYNAATPVSQAIVVNKASQTINFPCPVSPVVYPGPPITLTATASSGLTVTFSATGPGTVSGNVLTITGTGTVVVTASQAGNANYNPAPPVTCTIVVVGQTQAPAPAITGTTVTPGGGTYPNGPPTYITYAVNVSDSLSAATINYQFGGSLGNQTGTVSNPGIITFTIPNPLPSGWNGSVVMWATAPGYTQSTTVKVY